MLPPPPPPKILTKAKLQILMFAATWDKTAKEFLWLPSPCSQYLYFFVSLFWVYLSNEIFPRTFTHHWNSCGKTESFHSLRRSAFDSPTPYPKLILWSFPLTSPLRFQNFSAKGISLPLSEITTKHWTNFVKKYSLDTQPFSVVCNLERNKIIHLVLSWSSDCPFIIKKVFMLLKW